jgi:hypothetical protein
MKMKPWIYSGPNKINTLPPKFIFLDDYVSGTTEHIWQAVFLHMPILYIHLQISTKISSLLASVVLQISDI